jgi:hypothetical protein
MLMLPCAACRGEKHTVEDYTVRVPSTLSPAHHICFFSFPLCCSHTKSGGPKRLSRLCTRMRAGAQEAGGGGCGEPACWQGRPVRLCPRPSRAAGQGMIMSWHDAICCCLACAGMRPLPFRWGITQVPHPRLY